MPAKSKRKKRYQTFAWANLSHFTVFSLPVLTKLNISVFLIFPETGVSLGALYSTLAYKVTQDHLYSVFHSATIKRNNIPKYVHPPPRYIKITIEQFNNISHFVIRHITWIQISGHAFLSVRWPVHSIKLKCVMFAVGKHKFLFVNLK